MSEQRVIELDAAVGALVKDMRHLLGNLLWITGFLVILGVIQAVEAISEGRWVALGLGLCATALLTSAWWDTVRRLSKYGGPR